MRGIAKILRDLFDAEGVVSFERSKLECQKAGFELAEGTYRVNKSIYQKNKRMTVTAASIAEALAAATRLSQAATVVTTPVAEPAPVAAPEPVYTTMAIPTSQIDSDLPSELAEYFLPPEVDETHVINTELHALFDAIHRASFKEPQNVRLNGPAGCGKTTSAMEFAARFNRPLLVMDCANVREPRDWFGYKTIDPKTGGVVWQKSLFYRMVQHNGAVIVLDELNRINPLIANTLLPLLDGRRSTYLEEAGGKIKVGKNVVFFATTNEGREYTGTISLDLATADRMSTLIEVTYLPPNEETNLLHKRSGLVKDQCGKLVDIANNVRRKHLADTADSFTRSISTRMLLNAAEKMHYAGTKTLRNTLLTHFSSEGGETSERAMLLKLVQGKFGQVF
jgi:nitric oxide reductase NorQ protein